MRNFLFHISLHTTIVAVCFFLIFLLVRLIRTIGCLVALLDVREGIHTFVYDNLRIPNKFIMQRFLAFKKIFIFFKLLTLSYRFSIHSLHVLSIYFSKFFFLFFQHIFVFCINIIVYEITFFQNS